MLTSIEKAEVRHLLDLRARGTLTGVQAFRLEYLLRKADDDDDSDNGADISDKPASEMKLPPRPSDPSTPSAKSDAPVASPRVHEPHCFICWDNPKYCICKPPAPASKRKTRRDSGWER